MNVVRNAWLAAGLPSRCQPPPSTPSAVRRSRPPIWATDGKPASSMPPPPAASSDGGTDGIDHRAKSLGRPVNKRYWEYYEFTPQFEGAERIAEWDITRDDTDAFGLRSQQLGAKAWAEDAFATQIVPAGPRPR